MPPAIAPAIGTASAPSPSPPPAAAPPSPGISPGWRRDLAPWLQSHQPYPDEARRRGEEGSALVRFTVAQDGRVLDVALLRSSGSAAIDDAVRNMLTQARLPPFPASMTQASTVVTVQIRNALEP